MSDIDDRKYGLEPDTRSTHHRGRVDPGEDDEKEHTEQTLYIDGKAIVARFPKRGRR